MPNQKEHDHTVIGWQAWYENDVVYSSRTMDWQDLPSDGVLVVMAYEAQLTRGGDNYRSVFKGKDYYWVMPETGLEVFTGNEHPADRYSVDTSLVKRGKWVGIHEFQRTMVAAAEATEFTTQ